MLSLHSFIFLPPIFLPAPRCSGTGKAGIRQKDGGRKMGRDSVWILEQKADRITGGQNRPNRTRSPIMILSRHDSVIFGYRCAALRSLVANQPEGLCFVSFVCFCSIPPF